MRETTKERVSEWVSGWDGGRACRKKAACLSSPFNQYRWSFFFTLFFQSPTILWTLNNASAPHPRVSWQKGSGAILNTVKTKANPAMKTVYKFVSTCHKMFNLRSTKSSLLLVCFYWQAKDHAKMGIKEVKSRLKHKVSRWIHCVQVTF